MSQNGLQSYKEVLGSIRVTRVAIEITDAGLPQVSQRYDSSD